jgi:hypothetical protein
VSGDGLGEQHRPWCCPEPRCTPVHTLQGSDKPLSIAEPGETFVCFGAAPTVEFVYDGVRHVNDTRSCTYTALKGVVSYQENADDWRALSGAYSRAVLALLRFRDGDQGARNPDRNLIADETDVSR